MSVRNRERPAGRLLGPRTRAPTSPLPAPPAQLTQPQAFVPPPPPPPPQPQSQPEPSNEERNGETNGVDGRRSEDRPSYFESQDAYARSPDPIPQPQPQPVPQPEAEPSSSSASPEIQRKNTQDAPNSSSAAPLIRRDTTASLGPPAYTAHPPQQQPQPRAPPPLSPTHVHGQLPSIPPPPPLQPQQNISMQPPTSATGATFLHPGPPRSPAGTNGSLPSVPPTPTTPAHTHNSGPSRPSTSASSYTNTGTATTNSTLSAPTLQPAPSHFQSHSQAQRPGTATQVKRSVPARPPLPPLPQIELNPAPIPYKHLTLDAAQWTLSSSDLQALVSAAIRESARERSIRLLAPNVQAEIDRRLNELEREWDTAASGWRFEGMRRGNILSALQSIASSLPSTSSSSVPFPTGTGTLGGAPSADDDGEALHALLSQLHAAMGRMDAHAGSLLAAAHAKAGCERAVGTHKSSALAVALRKLNASYARRTKELGRERERRLVAEGEVDEAWRVAEEVAAEVDRLRAEKRAWEERERELTDALSAFSSRPTVGHRRGDSAATATGEGLRFVLTTEGEGEGGDGGEDTMNRRLSLASEDLTSVSRMSRISHISKAEVVPVTGKAVISAARYVAPLPDNTKEAKEDGDGGEPPSPVSEGFREGEGPTALIPKPGESEVGGSSVAASVGHGSDAEDEQTVEAPQKQTDEPATARPFPSTSTFKLPPAPSNSPPVPPPHVDPVLPSSHPRPHIAPAPDRPEHKRHKRASTTSQVSRVSAARTRSMRASKASLGLSVRGKGVVGGGEGAGEGRRVRRRASSVSSVPESGYGVEIRKERRRRGSFTLPAAATSSKVTAQDGEKGKEAGKGRERKDSDAFSIASASSAAASVQSRRREKERERMKAPPPVPALPVGEDEGSFLELGMMDPDAGEEGEGEGEKSAVLGEGASASFRFSAPAPQHAYPPRAEPLSTPSISTATSTTSKPRRPRSPTTLTLLSAFVSTPTSENPPDEEEDEGPGMSPAAASSVAPFANVAPINTSTQEGANGSTDILPSMSSSTSAHTPASEHPPEPQPESAVRLTTKLSIPHASGSGLPSTSMGAGSAGSPLSPGGGLAYLHTPASPAGPRPPGTIGHAHVRGVSAPGPRVLNSSTTAMPSRSVHVRPGSSAGEAAFSRPKFGAKEDLNGKERTLQHSASQPLSGVVVREEPKGAALRHSSAESGALPLVRSGTFGKVDAVARMGVDSPEIMQGKGEEVLSVEQAEDFSSPTPSAQGPGPSSSPPMPSPVHSLNPSTSSGPHPYAPSPAQLNHAHSGSLASTRSSLGVVLENGTPDEFGLHMHSSSSSPVLRPSRSGTFNLTRYTAPNSALEDDMWARGASDEWSRDGLSFDSSGASGSGVGKGAGGGGGADGEEVTATSPLVPRRGHSLELPQGGGSDGGARVRRSMSELLRFGLIGRRRPGSSGGGGSKSGVLGGGGGGGKTPVKESKDEDAEGILG